MVVEMGLGSSGLSLRFANTHRVDVKSGFSDPADFETTRSPIDYELPKLIQGSGSVQKDSDPTGLESVS
jgi:hypothetical protein